MQLALVTETYPPEVNGVALTVQSLLRNLVSLKHRVVLCRPRQPAPEIAADTRTHSEYVVRSAPLPFYRDLRIGMPDRAGLMRCWRELSVEGVYVATEGPLGLAAISAARRMGLPVVTGFHTRFDVFLGHYGMPWLAALGFAYLRQFHNRADCTLVPTVELQTMLEQRGFANVARLARAVDTGLFHPDCRDQSLRAALQVGPDDPLVLCVGRLAPEKNFELAIRAFRAMQAQAPRAQLVFVGDGPSRAALQAQVPEAQFVGMKDHRELAALYASSDVFLMPSLSETFGNVSLEAMASAVPVVAFDYGAAREHIRSGENGYLAPFADEAAFIERAVAAIVGWRDDRAIGLHARSAVLHLNPLRVAQDLVDLLQPLKRRSRQSVVVHAADIAP